MIRLPEVVAVTILPGHRLLLVFELGERRIFDVTPFLNRGPVFLPLQDEVFFAKARVGLGTVVWPNGADLDPELLFERSVLAD